MPAPLGHGAVLGFSPARPRPPGALHPRDLFEPGWAMTTRIRQGARVPGTARTRRARVACFALHATATSCSVRVSASAAGCRLLTDPWWRSSMASRCCSRHGGCAVHRRSSLSGVAQHGAQPGLAAALPRPARSHRELLADEARAGQPAAHLGTVTLHHGRQYGCGWPRAFRAARGAAHDPRAHAPPRHA